MINDTNQQSSSTLHFLDVETNIGVRAIDAGALPETVSIAIAEMVNLGKPAIVYHKEFRPLVPVDREAIQYHGLTN